MSTGFPIAFAGQRIGLLGGSFDPAHDGHAHITETALRRFGLDRIWWLVSPGNPLKPHGPAPLAQRIEMARRVMGHPSVEITDLEARLQTRLTADTIAALQARYRGVRFVWLMGSDNLAQFDQWNRWREIATRVPIGVLARPGTHQSARTARATRILGPAARLPESRAQLLPFCRPPAWVLINMPMSQQSSTAIRSGHAGQPEARQTEGKTR